MHIPLYLNEYEMMAGMM